MGSYDEAINGFLAGHDPKPDVVAYRQPGRVKTGLGVNAEYTFPRLVRVFARAGWNEGHNESFAYTEVNNSVQAGGDLSGALWHRSQDRLGVAVVSNGLSAPHREYLALGGQGFLLGDGTLRYGREDILETYYTAHRLARRVGVGRSAVHRPSRLQPGPRAGPRRDAASSRGLLITPGSMAAAVASEKLTARGHSCGYSRGRRGGFFPVPRSV